MTASFRKRARGMRSAFARRTKRSAGAVAAFTFFLEASLCRWAPAQPPLATRANLIWQQGDEEHVREALACLNMDLKELGFAKDHGQPRFALGHVRRLLHEPLGLPRLAERVLSVFDSRAAAALPRLAAELLEAQLPDAAPDALGPAPAATPTLENLLEDFARALNETQTLLAQAFGAVSEEERVYWAAASLADAFNAEDREDVREELLALGIPPAVLQEVLQEAQDLDPEPAALKYLAVTERVDVGALLAAWLCLEKAVGKLCADASSLQAWPEKPTRLEIAGNAVWVGSPGPDAYTEAAALILDPGGDDVYRDAAGAANGLGKQTVAVIVDLGGPDRYEGTHLLGAGAALWGLSLLYDVSGNDRYEARYAGQAAAWGGVASLTDDGGDDAYKAYAMGQGAAALGAAVLRDRAGDDTYEIGLCGQAFAGVRAVGLLLDEAGVDRYLAGGREPDHERHQDRFLSLAQGFAIGLRPFAGGGVAALVDAAGNDVYQADVYGQGASYWYSAGLLLDLGGHDTYTVYHYGQGSGIHLSAGLLYDACGDDTYTGHILAQGNAHDYAVGMLVDRAGDDTYTADQHAQGRAINNSFALLLDGDGDDAYFARQPDECQGIGNDGGHREYGSLALLLDLNGRDRYSCGAADGARMRRPWFGIVYDGFALARGASAKEADR